MGRLQDRQALRAKVGHGVEAPVPSMPANHGPVQEVRRQTEDRTRSCQLERAEVTCPKCEERRKKEEKQLSCCEDRYKKLESHYQRVTMVLVVMTTIVGKEVFDKALEILSIVPESPLTDAVSFGESTPGLIARGAEKPRKWPSPPQTPPCIFLAEVPPLTPALRQFDPIDVEPLFDSPEHFLLPEPDVSLLLALAGRHAIPARKR